MRYSCRAQAKRQVREQEVSQAQDERLQGIQKAVPALNIQVPLQAGLIGCQNSSFKAFKPRSLITWGRVGLGDRNFWNDSALNERDLATLAFSEEEETDPKLLSRIRAPKKRPFTQYIYPSLTGL